MILAWPLPAKAPLPRGGAGRRAAPLPILSALVGTAVLLLIGLEWWFLALPAGLQEVMSNLSRGRLYAAPGQDFFHPLQVWTSPFFQAGWWQGLPMLLVWWSVAASLERRWGSLRLLALMLVIAPLPASLLLMAGEERGQYGLLPFIMAAGGALGALEPRLRLPWNLLYVLPWTAAWRRLHSPGYAPLLLLLTWELLRLLISAGPGLGLLLTPIIACLCWLGSYLLVSSLDGVQERTRQRGLLAMASGAAPLDGVEALLNEAPELPLDAFLPLAERCVRENRRDIAQLLATYMALRAPDHPACQQLRDFLRQPEAAGPQSPRDEEQP